MTRKEMIDHLKSENFIQTKDTVEKTIMQYSSSHTIVEFRINNNTHTILTYTKELFNEAKKGLYKVHTLVDNRPNKEYII